MGNWIFGIGVLAAVIVIWLVYWLLEDVFAVEFCNQLWADSSYKWLIAIACACAIVFGAGALAAHVDPVFAAEHTKAACVECGNKMNDDDVFCSGYGERLQQEEKHCAECGEEISSKDKFCASCGAKVNEG